MLKIAFTSSTFSFQSPSAVLPLCSTPWRLLHWTPNLRCFRLTSSTSRFRNWKTENYLYQNYQKYNKNNSFWCEIPKWAVIKHKFCNNCNFSTTFQQRLNWIKRLFKRYSCLKIIQYESKQSSFLPINYLESEFTSLFPNANGFDTQPNERNNKEPDSSQIECIAHTNDTSGSSAVKKIR